MRAKFLGGVGQKEGFLVVEKSMGKSFVNTPASARGGAGAGAGEKAGEKGCKRGKNHESNIDDLSTAGSPFGLGPTSIIGTAISEREDDFIKGFISIEEIEEKFIEMLKRVDGRYSPFHMIDRRTGETKLFPVASRWNTEFNYPGRVKRKLLDEFRGLRNLKMFILTFDQAKADEFIPDWFVGSRREFYTAWGGKIVSAFLRRLKAFLKADRKMKGKEFRWNFVTWFMELHKSGEVHFHLVFRGGWLAAFSDLERLWGFGAVRYRPHAPKRGEHLAGYLTGYLTKDLRRMTEKDQRRQAALMWWFRRRLFNARHGFVGARGSRVSPFVGNYEMYHGAGLYAEFMGYARRMGFNSMQAVEAFVYGIKARTAFHRKHQTSDDEMRNLWTMFDEAVEQRKFKGGEGK